MPPSDDDLPGCLVTILEFVTLPAAILWDGFVLSKLWKWLLVPSFSIAPITVGSAIGLSLFVGTLMARRAKSVDQGDAMTRIITLVDYAILKPAFMLLLGYLVHLAFNAGWLTY